LSFADPVVVRKLAIDPPPIRATGALRECGIRATKRSLAGGPKSAARIALSCNTRAARNEQARLREATPALHLSTLIAFTITVTMLVDKYHVTADLSMLSVPFPPSPSPAAGGESWVLDGTYKLTVTRYLSTPYVIACLSKHRLAFTLLPVFRGAW
jgi:hypothetical protein